MDLRLAMTCGIDIPVPECKIVLHQPKIKEIAFIGEEDFWKGSQVLSLNKTMFIEDKVLLSQTTNFQIFMMIMSEKEAMDQKQASLGVLSLLLSKQKYVLTPRSLIITPENGESVIIDDSNFDSFQEVVRQIFCAKIGPMDTQAFNPANDKAQEIAKKLMRGRQRVAQEKGQAGASILSQYLSILTIGLHIPMQEVMDLTLFQLYDLIERYNLYINWDMDARCRLAGAKPENHPDDWMKNIH